MSSDSWVLRIMITRRKMQTAKRSLPEHILSFLKPIPHCSTAAGLEKYGNEVDQWWKHYNSILGTPSPPAGVIEYRQPRSDPYIFTAVKLIDKLCCYCREQISDTVDHVYPYSRGGQTDFTNLVGACKDCNIKKSDSLLEHSGLVLHWPERFNRVDPTPVWFHEIGSQISWKSYKISIARKKYKLVTRLHTPEKVHVRELAASICYQERCKNEQDYILRDFVINFPWHR